MKIDLADVEVDVLEEGDGWVVDAMWRGYRIGHAHCTLLENAELQLCDLVVEQAIPVPHTLAGKLLVALGCACSDENFRGNGVGSLLLDRIIAESKRRGIRTIWGSVVQKDLDDSPFLLEWYERHGFSIAPPDKRCLQNAVKKMQLEPTGRPSPGESNRH